MVRMPSASLRLALFGGVHLPVCSCPSACMRGSRGVLTWFRHCMRFGHHGCGRARMYVKAADEELHVPQASSG